jgi:hypothetical protein
MSWTKIITIDNPEGRNFSAVVQRIRAIRLEHLRSVEVVTDKKKEEEKQDDRTV